jgi:hypothetical protein
LKQNCLGNNVDSVGKISESANVFLERCRSGAPAVNFPIEDCDNQKRGRDSSNLKQLKMSIELIVVGQKNNPHVKLFSVEKKLWKWALNIALYCNL